MLIGLIVNPASSKDIRRLVAMGRVVTVAEKTNIVARLLAGLAAGPSVRVSALDDAAQVTRRAARMVADHGLSPEWLPVTARDTEADTVAAAQQLRQMGAALVVVVGGDGTLRAAVQGWPDAPVLLLPAGTNNAFSSPIDPTVAGFAAAHLEVAAVHRVAFEPRTRLEVQAITQATTEGVQAEDALTAVVDVVGLRDRWVGSRAFWDPDDLVEAFVTRSAPTTIGMAAVASAFGPLGSEMVRHLRFGPGRRLESVLGPGLVASIPVAEVEDLPVGQRVHLQSDVQIVALDGERRVLGSGAVVVACPGPRAFCPGRAIEALNRQRIA